MPLTKHEQAQQANIIAHLGRDFYQNAQKIIDDYYLQPLPNETKQEAKKEFLRDGYIERPIHGAMHVSRAQCWAQVVNGRFKAMFPEYTQNIFTVLTTELGLQESHIMTLVRYAVMFHDSARETEGEDYWDAQSAVNYQLFLCENGVSEQLAEMIAQAAALKDKPEELSVFLKNKGVSGEHIESYQYIRKLIYAADNLDIMRCVTHFQLERTLQIFQDVPGYDAEIHEPTVIALAQQVHATIKAQGDMMFPCEIISPRQGPLHVSDGSSHFSAKQKKAIEHATNACAVMVNDISSNESFTDYLIIEDRPSAKKALIPTANPLIHGSTAVTLALALRTQKPPRLFSAYGMVDHLARAPLGGELETCLDRWSIHCLTQISFGRIYTQDRAAYNLEKISTTYCELEVDQDDGNAIRKLQEHSKKMSADNMRNINFILIYYARARQLSHNDQDDAAELCYQQVSQELASVIKSHYFLALLGKVIFFNPDAMTEFKTSISAQLENNPMLTGEHLRIQQFSADNPEYNLTLQSLQELAAEWADSALYQFIKQQFSPQNLAKALSTHSIAGLQIRHIEADEKQDERLMTEFASPKQVFQFIPIGSDRKIELEIPPCQLLIQQKSGDADIARAESSSRIRDAVYSPSSELGRSVSNLIAQYATYHSSNSAYFDNGRAVFIEFADILLQRLQVLERIHSTPLLEIRLNQQEKSELQALSFPLIIICDEDHPAIGLFSPHQQEYRCDKPLVFGEDITAVATDTAEHQTIIKQMLAADDLADKVTVHLIQDLKKEFPQRITRQVIAYSAEQCLFRPPRAAHYDHPASSPVLNTSPCMDYNVKL